MEHLPRVPGDGNRYLLKTRDIIQMDFLHSREYLNVGDTVLVDCSHQSNILLTDDINFANYKSGDTFKHHGNGGFFKKLPASLNVPHNGYWNITIDLAGGTGNVTHSIRIIKA